MKTLGYDEVTIHMKILLNLLRSTKEKRKFESIILAYICLQNKHATSLSDFITDYFLILKHFLLHAIQSGTVLVWQNQTSLRGDEREMSTWLTRS